MAEQIKKLKLELETKDEQLKHASSNSSYDRYKHVRWIGASSLGHVMLVIDTQLQLKDDEEA